MFQFRRLNLFRAGEDVFLRARKGVRRVYQFYLRRLRSLPRGEDEYLQEQRRL